MQFYHVLQLSDRRRRHLALLSLVVGALLGYSLARTVSATAEIAYATQPSERELRLVHALQLEVEELQNRSADLDRRLIWLQNNATGLHDLPSSPHPLPALPVPGGGSEGSDESSDGNVQQPLPRHPSNPSSSSVSEEPRAPNGSEPKWRCKHSNGCKFVLYLLPMRGYLGEQFSQQRLAVMETMHLVRQLGVGYVLVEPLFVITPHDNRKIEERIRSGTYTNAEDTILGRYVVRAGDLYDLNTVGEYFEHGIVPWSEYLGIAGARDAKLGLDVVFMDHGPHPTEPGNKLACLPPSHPQQPKNQEFYGKDFIVRRTYCQEAIRNGGYPMTKCTVKGVSCYPAGKSYRTALLKAVSERTRDESVKHIGFFFWRSLISEKLYQWIQDRELDYVRIRRHLRFAPAVWDRAERYVAANLTRPFVAMHIRRGDKLNADSFRTLDKAAERINCVVRHTKSKSVFLMTDIQNDADLRRLTGLIRPPPGSGNGRGGFVRLPPHHWSQEVQSMFVEMAISAQADYFIPSDRAYWASTTPSRDIIEYRGLILGKDKRSVYWFGWPGKRWTDPAIDGFAHSEDLLEPCPA